ncbi:hypothetical protein [Novosphingobium kunmingense]|uniref:hypothetical protein n=1 Tax=Novosphingobium kunmingense TaxID=1211806 RepID=UPI000C2C3C55|nr:hypothetical protein [Novosphingobium kunmingense]
MNKHSFREDIMFTKTFSTATKLDKAIVLSVGAMLSFNLFVLTQQQAAPALAATPVAAATAQA